LLFPPLYSLFPLHDALPIFGFTFYFRSHVTEMFFNVLFKITSVCHTKGWVDITRSKHLRFLLWIRCPYWIDKETLQTTRFNTLRSEEHTSELQSRIDLVCRL